MSIATCESAFVTAWERARSVDGWLTDGEASLLIAGVGSLLGGRSKDIALNPKALRRAVREHRRILVADTSREALQAAAAMRFDAASATWILEDADPEKNP